MDNNAGQPGAFVTTTTTNNIAGVLDVWHYLGLRGYTVVSTQQTHPCPVFRQQPVFSRDDAERDVRG